MNIPKRPKNISAVIFDLDGTLLDTLYDIAVSMNTVLERNGFATHPIEKYRIFIGQGIAKLAKRALTHQNKSSVTVEDIVQELYIEYEQRMGDSTKFYDGIPQLLDDITSHNLPMAILSNKRDFLTQKLVAEFLGKWPFKFISGARQGFAKKPEPTLAIHIAEKLGIPNEECIFIGDTPADMQTALKAGMFPIGVLWGFRNKKILSEAGAKLLCESPREIYNFIIDY